MKKYLFEVNYICMYEVKCMFEVYNILFVSRFPYYFSLSKRVPRMISVTPVIARTFERTVYYTFSKQNFEQYIKNDQFAYRTGGSCNNALLKIQHDIYQALDDPKIEAVRVLRWIFLKRLIV